MENKELNEKESLELITRMIQNSKKNLELGSGNIFLLWGYLSLVMSVLVLLLVWQTGYMKWNWLWFAIPLVGFPLQAYLKKKTKLLVRTYTDKVIAEVWGIIGLFTAVAVLVYGGDAHMTKFIMPIIVLGSGIGVAISGSIINDKWMRYSGMISFFLGVFAFRDSTGVTVYEGFYNDYITFIICIVLMFIIPGHRLTREARRLQKKEVE